MGGEGEASPRADADCPLVLIATQYDALIGNIIYYMFVRSIDTLEFPTCIHINIM